MSHSPLKECNFILVYFLWAKKASTLHWITMLSINWSRCSWDSSTDSIWFDKIAPFPNLGLPYTFYRPGFVYKFEELPQNRKMHLRFSNFDFLFRILKYTSHSQMFISLPKCKHVQCHCSKIEERMHWCILYDHIALHRVVCMQCTMSPRYKTNLKASALVALVHLLGATWTKKKHLSF